MALETLATYSSELEDQWAPESIDAVMKGKGKGGLPKGPCYKCGAMGHLARDCYASQERIQKYQLTVGKGKGDAKGQKGYWNQQFEKGQKETSACNRLPCGSYASHAYCN